MVISAIKTFGLPMILTVRDEAHEIFDEINKRCEKVGVPPAFKVGKIEDADSLEDIYVHGDLDFRFEGFGLDFSHVIPRLSFWLHYKPESPEHVEVGRFCIPIRLLDKMIIKSLGV